MSRRRAAQVRIINPDAKYRNLILAKFTNCLMVDGKKSTAERIVYGAFSLIEAHSKENPLDIFLEALGNIEPSVEVCSRRVGGATYQVPVELRERHKKTLAIRWLIIFSRQRSEKTMRERLAGEVLDAYNKRGAAFKKREDTHKMAEANKAFSHYRW